MQNKFFLIFGIIVLFAQLSHATSYHETDHVIIGFDDVRILNKNSAPIHLQRIATDIFDDMTEEHDEMQVKLLNAKAPKIEAPSSANDLWRTPSIEAYALKKKTNIILTGYKNVLKKSEKIYTGSPVVNPSSGLLVKTPTPFCPRSPSVDCQNKSYRTISGVCNNLEPNRLWWGAASTPNKRLLPSQYDDKVSSPRTRSVTGSYLPNPRTIALNVFKPEKSVSEWSSFMTYFGQFVDHDISLTEQASYSNGFRKLCPCGTYDPDCWNIDIPYKDYANRDQKCMSFVRSTPSVNDFDCNLGPREQLNLQSAWLDLSSLYGFTDELYNNVTNIIDGTLKFQSGSSGEVLLPLLNGPCKPIYGFDYSRRNRCFISGDPRTEDNVLLSGIQTIFLRYHNIIADKIKDKSIAYQEARKILIAIYQNIIYGEYLPALLGERITKLYKLLPYEPNSGYSNDYNPDIYPQIINEFSTAAFRYGHTLLTQTHTLASRDYKSSEPKPLYTYLFNNQLYQSAMNDAVRGTLKYSSYSPNSQMTSYLTDWLFEGLFYGDSKRWSLPALNIWRGRDHGIPSYNKYRELCGLNPANSFEEFTNIPSYTIQDLKKTYKHPDDVDLFVGAFSEYPVKGGILGSTAACIVAKQFHDLKFGDRFYYEFNNLDTSYFSTTQLSNIRNITMSSILCSTIDVTYIQKFAFFTPNSDWNPIVQCKNIPSINFDLFLAD